MNYDEFLTHVIDDGIAAAGESYKNDDLKREGAIAGFEVCRGKSPLELTQRLDAAAKLVHAGRVLEPERYWRHVCFHAEIEWVCNVVSAMLLNQGTGVALIVNPTARGYIKAAEIVGVTDAEPWQLES
jgi:hypothetical protein